MNNSDADILALLWTEGCFAGSELPLAGGGTVRVLRSGSWDPARGCCRGAEVLLAGCRLRGAVLFGRTSDGGPAYGSAAASPVVERRFSCEKVLSVAEFDAEHAFGARGGGSDAQPAPGIMEPVVLWVCSSETGTALYCADEPVPQAVARVPDGLKSYLKQVRREGTSGMCGHLIADLDPFYRNWMFTGLFTERLARKMYDVLRLWNASDHDWNQTLYSLIFRYIGSTQNSYPYMKLARTVTYAMLSRERDFPENVEALLLGASGFLENTSLDDYGLVLKENFDYLRRKYSIVPLCAQDWQSAGNTFYHNPQLRQAELAALFSHTEFLFDNVISVRNLDDIHRVFCATASRYWTTHIRLGVPGRALEKRITAEKALLLGINVAAPLKFAYAVTGGNERLRSEAVELYERLPAEDHRYVKRWTAYKVGPQNALESQALVQLSAEYCEKDRCAVCRAGKRLIKSRFGDLNQIK